jgi:hypothetical protein
LKRKLPFYEIAHKIVTGSNKNKNFVDYKALNERNSIYYTELDKLISNADYNRMTTIKDLLTNQQNYVKLISKESGVSLHRLEQALYGHHAFPTDIANEIASETGDVAVPLEALIQQVRPQRVSTGTEYYDVAQDEEEEEREMQPVQPTRSRQVPFRHPRLGALFPIR